MAVMHLKTTLKSLGLQNIIDEVAKKQSVLLYTIAASSASETYALARNIPTNITGTLPSGVNSTFTLPAPVTGQVNESVVHFNTGANLPTIVYSGFTPVWGLCGIPIIDTFRSYTFRFVQINEVVLAEWVENSDYSNKYIEYFNKGLYFILSSNFFSRKIIIFLRVHPLQPQKQTMHTSVQRGFCTAQIKTKKLKNFYCNLGIYQAI